MSELNGRHLWDTVAGDPGESAGPVGEPAIFIRGEFTGSEPGLVREISVTIPITVGDTWADYAVAIETTVREIGSLGYAPGNTSPDITVERS